MKKAILILCVLFLVSCGGSNKPKAPDVPGGQPALAEQSKPGSDICRWNVGVDVLGKNSRHWNCPAMIAGLKTVPCKIFLGYFGDNTFGPSNDACIQEAINTGKVWGLRAHFAWTSHQPRTAQQLTPSAQQFNALCAANPGIECYPSAICEHGMNSQQSAGLHTQLRPILTASNMKQWVDSGTNAADPAAIRECHGNKVKCPIISQDGGDGDGNGALDVDVEAVKHNGSLVSMLWGQLMNCVKAHEKNGPSQRTDCPNPEQFLHWFRILSPMPAYPPGQRASGGQIYKPSSDNHGGCQGKDCKALWMTNPFPGGNPNTIPFTTIDGKPLGELTCYKGNTNCNDKKNWFQGRLVRYYANRGAYPIGQQAEALSKSEFIVINEGRAKIVVNAYRRDGVLRGNAKTVTILKSKQSKTKSKAKQVSIQPLAL